MVSDETASLKSVEKKEAEEDRKIPKRNRLTDRRDFVKIKDLTGKIAKDFRWRCAYGTHPFPSRTRWLRHKRPMVLYWKRYGRAGGCRIIKQKKLSNYIRY